MKSPLIRILILVISMSMIQNGYSQESKDSPMKKFPKPKMVPHSQWEAFPPVGFKADANRRNIAVEESIKFKDLELELRFIEPFSKSDEKLKDGASVFVRTPNDKDEIYLEEGSAKNFDGYHIAILAIHARDGELGSGLTEFEVCTIDSMPPQYANASTAGDATYRARIPHEIKMITLHHSGDAKPMTLEDDPVKKLQGLQTWGKNDKNWWDVPYHFLIAPNGTIYEGRDYHFMGETNTKYNPSGHLLISCMGNYEIQKPTPEVIKSITDLMTWAVSEFNVPLDQIYGHSDLADTSCPGKNLVSYLKDGTFVKGIKERLEKKP